MKEDLYSINESKSFSSEDSTIFEYVNTNIKNQIEINLKDPYTHKEEKYHLINEKNEMLLCKEDLFDKVKDEIGESYDIKIIELLKRKDEKDYYYINKEELKQRYLKNFFDLDKINKELLFNRNNPIEMKKLYEETIKKHPRIIYKDHIEKYPFFAWSGFFCCKRNEFYDLGLGISSYFKMIKLFIVFFFIISCINVYAIFHYSKYQSILKNDSWALKTTLGNTMITNYKLFINLNKNYLNCSDKIIGKIIFGIRFDNLEENDLQQLTNYVANNNENPPPNLTSFNYSESIKYSRIENDELITYNQKINRCFLKNECEFNSSTLSNNIYDLLFYECIDKNVTLNNDIPQNSLKKITLITAISTTVLFIILYYFYKFSIIYENNEYHKNKIIINNYTLKLSNLNFHTYDYYQEINNLIKHLNNIILKEIEKNKDYFKQQDEGLNFSVGIEFKNIDYLNIFDISISTVDKNKMDAIESIKTFKEEIKNIKIDNDTISKKIKNKLKHVYKDFHTLYNNITETKKNKKNKKNKGDELEDIDLALIPNESENLLKAPTLSLSKTKIIKIKDKKEKIKSNIIKISEDIIKLHIDNKRANFVDIYITFRNPSISNYIYNIYNKNKFKRFLYYLFCQGYKIKKYYYEKQWLNFDLCNTGPNDINWENFYYSNKRRRFQKVITFIISFIIIIITIVIIIFLKWAFYESLTFVSTSISLLIVIVNIVSITILEKFTLFEKNITLTNNVSSNILKSFILNSIVSTILIHISSKFSLIFTYEYFEDYFKVILSVITSMIFVTFSANGSAIYSYLKNLKNRYLDSKCNNGKTTKKKDKSEYEELYVGEEFPIGQRYSTILVNLTICFLYGSFCPIIYLFFTLFLIAIILNNKNIYFQFWKYLLKNEKLKKNEINKKKNNKLKLKKEINSDLQSENNNKINNRNNAKIVNNREFSKEKNLSADIINMNNKEEKSSGSINKIEHKNTFNHNKKIVKNRIIIDNKVNQNFNKQNKLDYKHETNKANIFFNSEKNIINSEKIDINRLEVKTSESLEEKDSKVSLNNNKDNKNNENNENKLIKGFDILKNILDNKTYINKIFVLKKIKENNNINKKIESIEKINKIIYISQIKYSFIKITKFINYMKKNNATQKLIKLLLNNYINKLKEIYLKIKTYAKKKKKIESIDKLYYYLFEKIYEIKKDVFINFKNYIFHIKKIIGTEKLFNFFFKNSNYQKSNAFMTFKKYINNNKKIEGCKNIFDYLIKKNNLNNQNILDKFKSYINENKKIESIERINIFFNNKEEKEIKNAFFKLKYFSNVKKKFKSIEILYNYLICKLLNIKVYALNNIIHYINERNNYYIRKEKQFEFLEQVIYKIIIYNKIKAMEMIKIFVEKNKKIKKYNTNIKKEEYKEKNILNNKLNKSTTTNIIINKSNVINKSQDNIISSSTHITLNSKSSSYLSKQNTVKKWINNNKIDNTTFSFKIDSKNNNKNNFEPSTKNFMSFTLSTNKNEKTEKKSDIVDNNLDNEKEDEIWTINVEKWEVNQTIDDSFYKNKNES